MQRLMRHMNHIFLISFVILFSHFSGNTKWVIASNSNPSSPPTFSHVTFQHQGFFSYSPLLSLFYFFYTPLLHVFFFFILILTFLFKGFHFLHFVVENIWKWRISNWWVILFCSTTNLLQFVPPVLKSFRSFSTPFEW